MVYSCIQFSTTHGPHGSSCDESQTGVSLYSPPDQTGILWQQWPPVTQNVLHSQVVPNKLKASVRGDTRINTSLVPIHAFLGSCKQLQTGAKFVTVITKKCQKYLNMHSPVQHLLYCFCWPCEMWTKSFDHVANFFTGWVEKPNHIIIFMSLFSSHFCKVKPNSSTSMLQCCLLTTFCKKYSWLVHSFCKKILQPMISIFDTQS